MKFDDEELQGTDSWENLTDQADIEDSIDTQQESGEQEGAALADAPESEEAARAAEKESAEEDTAEAHSEEPDGPENTETDGGDSAFQEQKDGWNDIGDQVELAVQKLVQDTVGTIQEDAKEPDDTAESEEDEEEAVPGKKKSKKGLIAVGVLAGLLVLAGGGYYGSKVYHYQSRFFQGTEINGIDCSEMTSEQVEDLIRKAAEDYRVTLQFRGGQERTIEGTEIGYEYVSDGSVARILGEQNAFAWPLENSKEKSHEVQVAMQFSEEKLDQVLAGFPEMQESNMTAPADAYLTFQDATFLIVDEVYGNSVRTEDVKNSVTAAIEERSDRVDLEEEGAYNQPSVTKDDADLIAKRDQLNGYINAHITYQLPGGATQVIDGNLLKEWLAVDENGNYSRDEELWNAKIAEYVANLADTVNTYGQTHVFPATGISDGVEIKQYGYGWRLDQDAEIAQLTQDLENHVSTEREPAYSNREFSTENAGFGNTYVEIDISRQRIWFYKNGSLIVDSDCVTGMMVRSRYTPGGIFTVKSKTSPRTLRGPKQPDGSYEWESYVQYWMPFNGGIGLHDASWRGSFGGTIYKNGGSHGCINLPTKVAATIYQNIDVGTPVIVYYSRSYSVAADPTPEPTPKPAEPEAENVPEE